jgi:hypothetical protein
MRRVGLSLCLAAAAIAFACGGNDGGGGGQQPPGDGEAGEMNQPGDGGASAGGKKGDGGTGNAGTANTGNMDAGGEGGGSDVIGVVSHATPRSGYGNVVDGIVGRSKNFTMILSVGEEPGGNLSMGSSSYRINLGVVGSTQK